VHLLAKPTGAVCNLDCTYCFFLSKEMLYPASSFRMADDLLELYLRQASPPHGSPNATPRRTLGEAATSHARAAQAANGNAAMAQR